MVYNKNFIAYLNEDLDTINGGGLGGAIAGAILVGAYGMTAVVIGGGISANAIWKGYTSGALSGAAIGALSPI